MISPNVLLLRELSTLEEPLASHPVVDELERHGFFNGCRFTFVGVYYSADTDTTVIGYPKYIAEEIAQRDAAAVIRHVSLICQVVEQARPYLEKSLFDNSYDFNAYHSQPQRRYVNRYQLAVTILQDYMVHGIYFSKTTHVARGGNGPIQWQHTLQRATPIFDRNVLYLDTFHCRTRQDYSQLITHLHSWIVLQCARLLQGMGQYHGLELPETETTFDNTDLSQFVPYLLSKLSTVFSDREIRLVKALSAWCGQSAFYQRQMGVTCFDRIWEYAAKKVFGNIEDTRSGPPSYFVGREFQGVGGAIPDILRAFRHEGQGVIGILDAKYYCPRYLPEAGLVLGAPANRDLAKQIGYYHYLKQLYSHDNLIFTNALLFPAMLEGALLQNIGYASPNCGHYREIDHLLEITDHTPPSQDRVLLYQVDPEALFQACLAGKRMSDSTFYEQFLAIPAAKGYNKKTSGKEKIHETNHQISWW